MVFLKQYLFVNVLGELCVCYSTFDEKRREKVIL